MDGNFPSNENNNNKEIQDLKNEPTRNKLQLRKRNIHEVLDKKKVLLKDAEVDDKILNEIANSNYSKQIEDLKKLLTSTNEQNIIKALKFINNVVCPKTFNDKLKSELIKSGGINIISKLFYFNSNEVIFSFSCSILEIFCTQYFEFSTQFINDEGIKLIYDKLSRNFSNNVKVVSHCIRIYKESLDHLLEINENYNKYNGLSYNSKKYLCHFTNWVLCEKQLFSSFETDTFLAFFRFIELLKRAISVPNQYELDFEQGAGSMDNLFSYVLEQPVKDLEYFAKQNYLEFLILLSKEPKYTKYLTGGQLNIFDVIKKLCGYLYLNQNSTNEERENYPTLEPFMLGYCFEIMTNLSTELIKRDDIVELVYTLFKNFKFTVKYSDIVPVNIMDLLVSLSENITKDEKIYNFIFSPERNIIYDCVKCYVKNNDCYIRVLQFLVNIFEVKNFSDNEKVKFADVMNCISNGLEIENNALSSKSVYCIRKIMEINAKNNYGIDLYKYFVANNILEKLKNLVLNKNYSNISEEENADELISIIENMIKAEENK